MEIDTDAFLEHHGVKGQRWGVRSKSRSGSGGPSADVQRHRAAKSKPLSHLDDKQLRELVNRINMEQQYRRLSPSKAQQGHAAVKGLLAAGVTLNGAMAFAGSPAGKALGRKLKKATTLFPTLGN